MLARLSGCNAGCNSLEVLGSRRLGTNAGAAPPSAIARDGAQARLEDEGLFATVTHRMLERLALSWDRKWLGARVRWWALKHVLREADLLPVPSAATLQAIGPHLKLLKPQLATALRGIAFRVDRRGRHKMSQM